MTRVVVAKTGEIPPGERKLVVPFKGKAGIGVFNIDGEYFALRNLCPHKLGPLCAGHVGADAHADAPPRLRDTPGRLVGGRESARTIRVGSLPENGGQKNAAVVVPTTWNVASRSRP